MMKFCYLLAIVFISISCSSSAENSLTQNFEENSDMEDTLIKEVPMYCNETTKVGAERIGLYIDLLKGKKIGVIGNQSSMVNETHLVDTLVDLNIDVVRVFSPEHGFRGKADAGESVKNGVDVETGLEVISLYGKNKKPKKEQLEGIDVLLFDIQDVGARFYTYISTLHYVMEAAAENNIKVILLDRPNPNGHYVDGPVLKEGYTSFVGMHNVPVVHGMSIGEYAMMINGEGWLKGNLKCDLKVINCEGWDHSKFYELPIAPSPNLPNMTSVYLYPSLCFFEGTVVSIGRGTSLPFQCAGHPGFEVDVLERLFKFTPLPNEGSKHPKLENELCYGYDLSDTDLLEYREKKRLDLTMLLEFYAKLNMNSNFFLSNDFINLLAGGDDLQSQILNGNTIEEIENSWQKDLDEFKEIRKKYLLYNDVD
jgi:uncharacterized protein YbbC (DUF1343 family)